MRIRAKKKKPLKVKGREQAPMGAHPPEAPKLDKVLVKAFKATQPPGFRDHPESAVEAADIDVEDTIGGE